MGSNYSYLKIRVTDYTAGFVFQHAEGYKRITIAAGHPDNSSNTCIDSDSTIYDSYGNWYYYDGNSENLKNVLTEFNPRQDRIDFLICRLETECNLGKYESTWDIIIRWANCVKETISNIPISTIGWIASALFHSGTNSLPSPQ